MRITFVIANTFRTMLAAQHENQSYPYKKRTVTIDLTTEQLRQLKLNYLGNNQGVNVYEEYLDCYIEN